MKRAAFHIVIALSAIGAAALAPAARAQPAAAPSGDPMAAFYGNTLTVAVPAAYYYAKRFIDADGTWYETRSGQLTLRGKWYVKDGQACSVQTEPALPNPRHYCYAPSPHTAGDEWVTTDPDTGNDVVQAIEAGRPPAPAGLR